MIKKTVENVYVRFYSKGMVVYTRLVLELTILVDDNSEEIIIHLDTERNFEYDAIELTTNGKVIFRKAFMFLRPPYRAGIKEEIRLITKINKDIEK